MEERGLYILNGKIRGDWEGEYTYVRERRNTVTDYVFVNQRVQDRVLEFRVEGRADSDHMPISLDLEEAEEKRGRGEERKCCNKEEERNVICWDIEVRKEYKDKTEEIGWKKQEEKIEDKKYLKPW